MSNPKPRLEAPRPDFAQNHSFGGVHLSNDTQNGATSEGLDEPGFKDPEKACLDERSFELGGISSQHDGGDLRQNDNRFCHFDKNLFESKFGTHTAESLDDLTAKMSGFEIKPDKMTGKSANDGQDQSETGQNVSFEVKNCHFDNESDDKTRDFAKMTKTDEIFPCCENDKPLIQISDLCEHGRSNPISRSPLTPKTWQEAEKLAKLLCKTKLVPPGFESPDLCLIAILQGMEMGLPPLTALQRMALVEGKLTLWGDGALALVLKSGLCTSITEWMGLGEQDGSTKENGGETPIRDMTFDPLMQKREDDWIAFCEVTRAHWSQPIRRSFSVFDAKRAGLWKKEGPWLDYPKRMLQMRARAFALRDAFAHVLGGLYVREEIEPKGVCFNQSRHPTLNKDLGTIAPAHKRKESVQPQSFHEGPKASAILNADQASKPQITSHGNAQPHKEPSTSAASQRPKESLPDDQRLQTDVKNIHRPQGLQEHENPSQTEQIGFYQKIDLSQQDMNASSKSDFAYKAGDRSQDSAGLFIDNHGSKADDDAAQGTDDQTMDPTEIAIFKKPDVFPIQPQISNQSLIWSQAPKSHPEKRKAPPPPVKSAYIIQSTEPSEQQLNDQKQKIETPKKTKTNNSEANHQSDDSLSQANCILTTFKTSLRECQTQDELDACRHQFQPALDTLRSDDLDQAAQIYLDHEARIEGEQNRLQTSHLHKRLRQSKTIRRWKTQYKAHQRKRVQRGLVDQSQLYANQMVSETL
jgi:hypothetical protein